jgi:hypothetical protein
MSGEQYDIVYMWVDDQWPGFADEMLSHAQSAQDRNPNRTRDNLDSLKFSLRSVEKFAPWRGRVFVVTSRPQCPPWLNRSHPAVRVVHHDEIMPATMLPTYNSFAIQSWLHTIPGLSRRFVSFDDDMLLMSPTAAGDFVGEDGRIRYSLKGLLPNGRAGGARSPWNAALANNAALLNEIDPAGRHPGYMHGPKMFDIAHCVEIVARWPEAFDRTRRARFRAHDSVAMEALLPQYLVASGRATAVHCSGTPRRAAYLGLENFAPWNRFWLGRIAAKPPKFLTLNDNFGPKPRPSAVQQAKRWLEAQFPAASAYEVH